MAKHVPQRMCVICREMKPKAELIRLVKQEDLLVVDQGGRKPGRGLYLCLDSETIDELFTPKRLEKLIRSKISEENRQAVEMELRALALEHKVEQERLNRPEIVTVDDAGRTVRRITKKSED